MCWLISFDSYRTKLLNSFIHWKSSTSKHSHKECDSCFVSSSSLTPSCCVCVYYSTICAQDFCGSTMSTVDDWPVQDWNQYVCLPLFFFLFFFYFFGFSACVFFISVWVWPCCAPWILRKGKKKKNTITIYITTRPSSSFTIDSFIPIPKVSSSFSFV